MKLIKVMLMILCVMKQSGFAYSGTKEDITKYAAEAPIFVEKNLGDFNIKNAYKSLLPSAQDRKFAKENNIDEDDILNPTKERFKREVAQGKIIDPTKIDAKDLNEQAQVLSLKNTESAKDKSGTTPQGYMDIAVSADEESRKYKNDIQEEPFVESAEILKDPLKKLKEYGVNIECEEEEIEDLEPEYEEYVEKEKHIETVEENEICEESEPVIFKCDRVLNLTCKEFKEVEKEANKKDFNNELDQIFKKVRVSKSICVALGSSGRHGTTIVMEQIKFLNSQGVCAKNVRAKLAKYWKKWSGNHGDCIVGGNIDIYLKILGERRGHSIKWQDLMTIDCTEKQCLQWQETWDRKCEQKLKKLQ